MRWLLPVLLAWLAGAAQVASAHCPPWPQWQQFRSDFLEPSGRVVDRSSAAMVTVSEGQAYALFFALVDNDRDSFKRILDWTENNLAQGDFTRHLPAWKWGHRDDGSWGVMDSNPAADADVWIAYTLAEAGRLWKVRRYTALSQLLGRRILDEETAVIPGLGRTLLPGPVGFHPAADSWRLNASYVPLQLLRRLAAASPDVDWAPLLESSRQLILGSAPRGFAADWMLYRPKTGFEADVQTQRSGSYDAIRVYLWAGMMDARDPLRAALLAALKPMAQQVVARGLPPESVDIASGETRGTGPVGFSAALLPFLNALNLPQAEQGQRQRVEADPPASHRERYYDNVLSLFGLGWAQGQFRFDPNGALLPRWSSACTATPPRSR